MKPTADLTARLLDEVINVCGPQATDTTPRIVRASIEKAQTHTRDILRKRFGAVLDVARIQKALKPFAAMAAPYESFDGQHNFLDEDVILSHAGTKITVGDCREARSLLAILQ